jgi:hypothetical protein
LHYQTLTALRDAPKTYYGTRLPDLFNGTDATHFLPPVATGASAGAGAGAKKTN